MRGYLFNFGIQLLAIMFGILNPGLDGIKFLLILCDDLFGLLSANLSPL